MGCNPETFPFFYLYWRFTCTPSSTTTHPSASSVEQMIASNVGSDGNWKSQLLLLLQDPRWISWLSSTKSADSCQTTWTTFIQTYRYSRVDIRRHVHLTPQFCLQADKYNDKNKLELIVVFFILLLSKSYHRYTLDKKKKKKKWKEEEVKRKQQKCRLREDWLGNCLYLISTR